MKKTVQTRDVPLLHSLFWFLSVEALEVNGKLVGWKLAWGRGFPSRAKGYGRPKYFAADALMTPNFPILMVMTGVVL